MTESRFYSPEEVRPLYDQIVPVYQAAFAGEPWYEVSKCADTLQRCVGGLSPLAVGSLCEMCNNRPSRLAYEPEELVGRFEAIAESRPTAWYTERTDSGLVLAAVAWEASADIIAREKYLDVPTMADWMQKQIGAEPVIWLDEVFADRTKRPAGNLARFSLMNSGFMRQLGNPTLAYRTINDRMIAATKRDFDNRSRVFVREVDLPDRREFVVIKDKS